MSCVDRVVVATDSDEIESVVNRFGGQACLTSPEHESGTDRVAEVARGAHGVGADIVVNFQPDEPFLPEAAVSAAVEAVAAGADVATLATPIVDHGELTSSAVVKVVRAADGRALYFSRAPIPHARDARPELPDRANRWLRHIGLYAYSKAGLERWVGMPVSQLEMTERLEQLRALEGGMGIHVSIVDSPEAGIDTPEDLERANRLLSKGTYV